MKSKSLMLMVLSMGFGLIAAIGISQVMGRSNAPTQPVTKMGPVVVAVDHLEMNTILNEENVRIENWPINIIPEDAVTSLDETKEMAVRARTSKGSPLFRSAMIEKQLIGQLGIPEGKRVVAIKVSGDDTVAGLLNPGDKVDVIGLFRKKGSSRQQQSTSRTFLRALSVYSVNSRVTAVADRSSDASSGSAIVGVLVTEKQAEDIFLVQKTGDIKLVMRGDNVSGDEEPESLEDIMGLVDHSDDHEPAEDAGTNKSLFPAFDFGAPEKTMVIWNGPSPEKVVFTAGALPTREMAPPAYGDEVDDRFAPKRSLEEEGDRGDFDGSAGINRGLGQDQYPGK